MSNATAAQLNRAAVCGGPMNATTTHQIRRIGMAAAVLSLTLVPLVAQTGSTQPGGSRQGSGRPMGRRAFGGPPGGGIVLERFDQALAFTDAQRTQIHTLLTEQRDALKTTIASLRQAQSALDSAVMQTPADDTLLQTRVTDVAAPHGRIQHARTPVDENNCKLLTAYQK